MKHISILVLQDATMSCIDSSYQILTRVNDFLKYQGKDPFYKVEMVGIEKNTGLNNGLYSIHVNKTIDEISHTDVVVIPLICGDFSTTFAKKKQLELGNKTINEIIYDAGYNDVDAFRRVFKKHTDLSLADYRKRYRV